LRLRRGISAREFVQALRDEGFIETRIEGSHHRFKHPDGRRVTAAYHKTSDTFPIGTLKGMIADAGWNDEDLRRLGLSS
jgi:predicted RNA binding protein YcfA (HicA-like mRNA interferase family)